MSYFTTETFFWHLRFTHTQDSETNSKFSAGSRQSCQLLSSEGLTVKVDNVHTTSSSFRKVLIFYLWVFCRCPSSSWRSSLLFNSLLFLGRISSSFVLLDLTYLYFVENSWRIFMRHYKCIYSFLWSICLFWESGVTAS